MSFLPRSNSNPLKQEANSCSILLGLKSYQNVDGGAPPRKAMIYTVLAIVTFFSIIEVSVYWLVTNLQNSHPVLKDNRVRLGIARCVGYDALFALILVFIGLTSPFHGGLDKIFSATMGNKTMPAGGYEQRMFAYNPAGFRVALFCFAYQVKNLVNTFFWEDGSHHLLHHGICLVATWGVMYPGCAQFYAPFFAGITEISTFFLCLLSLFDDAHPDGYYHSYGLSAALPKTKLGIFIGFAITVLLCSIVWPVMIYFLIKDCYFALQKGSPYSHGRRWILITVMATACLSVLQIVWLYQVIRIAFTRDISDAEDLWLL